MKKTHTVIKFAGQSIIVGMIAFIFMLTVAKHNEIHDLLFSETSKLIATIVLGAITCVVAGYSICSFQMKALIAKKQNQLNYYKELSQERLVLMKALSNDLAVMNQTAQEKKDQQLEDRQKTFLADTEDFPVTPISDDILEDYEEEPTHLQSPAEED